MSGLLSTRSVYSPPAAMSELRVGSSRWVVRAAGAAATVEGAVAARV